MKTLKIVGYLTAAVVLATLAYNYNDVVRYIRIERM
jgi:hypothetical protein